MFAPQATASINTTLNFQGKIANSDGTNVPNGNYSLRFRLYTDPAADAANPCASNSCVWEETYAAVAVTSGIFNVQLGSITPLSSVDFNNPALYLGMKVGSDVEMSPRISLTAAPYAFNSQQLNGMTSDNFVQLGQGLQTDGSATNTSLAINKTAGTAKLVDLQRGGVTKFQIANDGSALMAGSTGAVTLLATDATADTVSLGNSTVVVDAVGAISRSISAGNTATTHLDSGSQSQYVAIGAQTDNLVEVSNSGYAPTTDNANGIHVDYTGGNAAVSGSGMRIDYAPGSTGGGSWSGLHIAANSAGAAAGVNSYGITLDGPSVSNGGTNTAIKIASGWDIGLDIGSGGIQLAAQSNPAPPTANSLKIYAKTVDGRLLLKAIGPHGVDYPLQPSLFQNQVSIINVQSGTASNYFGTNRSVSGTGVSASFDENYGYMAGYSTGTTANTSAGISNNLNQFARGSQVGANGFFLNIRGAMQDSDYGSGSTGTRLFVGMNDHTIAQATASQNAAGNRVGFSYDTGRGDTNWMLTTKDGSSENLIDTGLPFLAGKAYDWYLYVPPYPDNATIYWRIDNMTDGTSQEGTVTANLPTGSAAMRAMLSIRNLTSIARTVSYQRIYVESDR